MAAGEPHATQEEQEKCIIHYNDVPPIELIQGITGHIVSAERLMINVLTAKPHSVMPTHRHENEQMMIVLDGEADIAVAGKLYHMGKGDVVIFPSNVDHAAYISDKGFHVIDIFTPPRQDFLEKMKR
jgi:quercetin dioxygenase-like cupin family protein